MIRKLKDKFFIFELITGLLMLIVCVQLVKLQLADHNKYLEQSRQECHSVEIIIVRKISCKSFTFPALHGRCRHSESVDIFVH